MRRHPAPRPLAFALLAMLSAACSGDRGWRNEPVPQQPAAPHVEPVAPAAQPAPPTDDAHRAALMARYEKREVRIPMRDGVKLFTAIYVPRDKTKPHPFLINRTPYSVRPYGTDQYPNTLGPSSLFDDKDYIVVRQDVRGRFMSEGEFVNVRPQIEGKTGAQIDESSDAWDTIDWLVKNVENNNGKAGMWGISYPGFYAAAGMIDAHPALVAVSPQAPIADWFFDDFHHCGTFFLPHFFNFFATFGHPRPAPTTEFGPAFDHGTPDGYQFFLDLGPLSNVDAKYYHGDVAYWAEVRAHPNRDDYWKARDLQPHLKHVAPAVLTVGGWYDAEDLFGALNVYRAIERQQPGIENALVMGPWVHGGWARNAGDKLGDISFGGATSEWYRANVELPFFEHHLKGEGDFTPHEAFVFETGTNAWRTFEQWPPAGAVQRALFCAADSALVDSAPGVTEPECDSFTSDPKKPVPFTQRIDTGMVREYMVEDQRFAARRPDVLVYATPPLEAPVTIAGPLEADLFVSTTAQSADWIVKLIDVLPPDTPDPTGKDALPPGVHLGGYQRMVRSEAFRGRFRDSYEHPEPFVPGEVTQVRVPLQDVLHTFGKGHRIMVQVQSTWFPLVDLDPQKWVDNIFDAKAEDFTAATHSVWRSAGRASCLRFQVIPTPDGS